MSLAFAGVEYRKRVGEDGRFSIRVERAQALHYMDHVSLVTP